MECLVPGGNLKILSKALYALSRIGDELYIEGQKEGLYFVTFNSNSTVCSKFHFLDAFFSSYSVPRGETVTCKICMKIFLPLFKNNVERKLEYFKLEYEANAEHMVCKMKYKEDDIVMVHNLRLMDGQSIEVKTDRGGNNMGAPSTFYGQILSMFGSNDDEITWEITKDKVVTRNYCPGIVSQPKKMRTEIKLKANEFHIYKIVTETCVSFSLKPLRVLIQFAEAFDMNLDCNFDTGGKPITITLENDTFDVNFIVATLNPDDDTNSSLSTPPICVNGNKSVPKDIDDMEVQNWDSEPRSKETSFGDFIPEKGTEEEDVIPDSPERKRVRLIFGRCFDPTFHSSLLSGEVLAENSDSE